MTTHPVAAAVDLWITTRSLKDRLPAALAAALVDDLSARGLAAAAAGVATGYVPMHNQVVADYSRFWWCDAGNWVHDSPFDADDLPRALFRRLRRGSRDGHASRFYQTWLDVWIDLGEAVAREAAT